MLLIIRSKKESFIWKYILRFCWKYRPYSERADRSLFIISYDRSDYIGTSRLEQQYEDVLKGKKAIIEHVLDGSRNIVGAPKEKLGERGKDLVLTVDMEFQKTVEQIVVQEVERVKEKQGLY
ncbi:hypothetical protein KHA80_03405 [Anaerobacillus sp. HL2]|nr:hypothetical protein KHA80_03405 [Anaerobacillus sp. HL2]